MKILTNRVPLVSLWPSFQKKICPTKNGGHFEFSKFSWKLQNTKVLVSRKLCQIERIWQNFWSPGHLKTSLCKFQWIFHSPKIAAILKHTVSKITTLPKNHTSYILALLSYKQNFLTWLSCHYFSFSGDKLLWYKDANLLVFWCQLMGSDANRKWHHWNNLVLSHKELNISKRYFFILSVSNSSAF